MDQQPLPPGPPAPPPAAPLPSPHQVASAETTARIAYVLFLVSLVSGVTALVAVILAYVNRQAAPPGLDTHYRFLIRTFWIGLLYAAIGGLLALKAIGFVVLAFTAVWMIVRCVKGLKLLGDRQPIPDPGTWLW